MTLAGAVGIKASHIAYIENGHRKPSISLINRLGEALELNTKELLVLAHPEVKQIIDGDRRSAKKSEGAWLRFASNRALLRHHAITKGELKVLKQVAMLQPVARPGQFIFILNAIRQAAPNSDEASTNVCDAPANPSPIYERLRRKSLRVLKTIFQRRK